MNRLARALLGLLLSSFACSQSSIQHPPVPPTLAALAITPSSLELSVGQTQSLGARALYSDDTFAPIASGDTWASSAPGVATVSGAGLLTAIAPGTAIITLDYLQLSAAAVIEVTGTVAPTLVSLSLPAGPLALAIGATAQLVATGHYSDQSTSPLGSAASWRCSDATVASVSASGLVTALAAGSATITASDGALSATLLVQVAGPALESVSLTGGASRLQVGGDTQLQLLGTFSSGPTRDLSASASWSSSDAMVATVSGGTVSALKNGVATITASVVWDGVTRSATLPIAVGPVTDGKIFYAGAYADGVAFAGASGATNAITIDASTTNPAGHGSLKIVFPASGFTGGLFEASDPHDLTAFDSLTFWAKSSAPLSLGKVGLGENGGIAPDNAAVERDGLAISTTWTKYVVPLPNPAMFIPIYGLASINDASNRGPATLWLSDLQYEALGPSALGAATLSFTSGARTLETHQTTPLASSDLQLSWSIGGGAVTLSNPNLDYFLFASDDPSIATVSTAGVITGVAAGTAHISASLGALHSSNSIAVTVSSGPYDPGAGWTLVWSDEFDGTALDTSTWNYDLGSGGWGNSESECYQAQNAAVAGGYLTITAKEEVGCADNAPYTSARIQTAEKKQFTYGKFSMRAKLPYSQGMWPAFWMLGADSNSQGGIYGGNTSWPSCGEIDIMEMIGGLADGSGDYTTHGTLHYMNSAGRDPGPSYAYRYGSKLSDDFHLYEIIWTPHGFTWLFDGLAFGTKIMATDMTALNKPMFLLLNLAIGGPWGGWANSSTVFPQTYVIDYVRQYTNSSITDTGAAGLSSTWHLMNCAGAACTNGAVTGVTPAGLDMQSAPGTVSGFQPVKTLSAAANWYSPALTGSYEAGAWQLGLFTTSPGAASVVKAELFAVAADGSSAVSLGSAQVDTNATGGGNHLSYFSFTGAPATTFANQRIKLVLTPVSGVAPQMIYNGNDFDTALTAPWSPAN